MFPGVFEGAAEGFAQVVLAGGKLADRVALLGSSERDPLAIQRGAFLDRCRQRQLAPLGSAMDLAETGRTAERCREERSLRADDMEQDRPGGASIWFGIELGISLGFG